MSAPSLTAALSSDSRPALSRLEWAFLAATLLGAAVALSANTVDPDSWGHVQYGVDALAAGELPRTATHTFTAQGHPWVNHENLAEVVFALGYGAVGTL